MKPREYWIEADDVNCYPGIAWEDPPAFPNRFIHVIDKSAYDHILMKLGELSGRVVTKSAYDELVNESLELHRENTRLVKALEKYADPKAYEDRGLGPIGPEDAQEALSLVRGNGSETIENSTRDNRESTKAEEIRLSGPDVAEFMSFLDKYAGPNGCGYDLGSFKDYCNRIRAMITNLDTSGSKETK